MSDAAENLLLLQELEQHSGWKLICELIDRELERLTLSRVRGDTLDQVAISALKRDADIDRLMWFRCEMLPGAIKREKDRLSFSA